MPNLTSSRAAGQASPAEVRPRPGPGGGPTFRIFDPTEPPDSPGPPPPGPPPPGPPPAAADGRTFGRLYGDAGDRLDPGPAYILTRLKQVAYEVGQAAGLRLPFGDLAERCKRSIGHFRRRLYELRDAGFIALDPDGLDGRGRVIRFLDEPDPGAPPDREIARAGARYPAEKRAPARAPLIKTEEGDKDVNVDDFSTHGCRREGQPESPPTPPVASPDPALRLAIERRLEAIRTQRYFRPRLDEGGGIAWEPIPGFVDVTPLAPAETALFDQAPDQAREVIRAIQGRGRPGVSGPPAAARGAPPVPAAGAAKVCEAIWDAASRAEADRVAGLIAEALGDRKPVTMETLKGICRTMVQPTGGTPREVVLKAFQEACQAGKDNRGAAFIAAMQRRMRDWSAGRKGGHHG